MTALAAMKLIEREVEALFGQGQMPQRETLVARNGFDCLDKAAAVDFYAGKSWEDVLRHLRKLSGYELEEWSVLQEPALSYYGRAHLQYLLETLASDSPDDQFVAEVFHQLYQLLFMHGRSPFSPAQTSLLVELAGLIPKVGEQRGKEDLCGDFVQRSVDLFLKQLADGR
jgi:hypothetical protein